MRFSWVLALVLAVSPVVRAAEKLPLVGTGDVVEEADAKATRAIGVGLFIGGLIVTLAGQVLTGVAINSWASQTADQSFATQDLVISASVTQVAGNAMLAAGIGLWGVGNKRLQRVAIGPGGVTLRF
jgi:hypothetical protein